MITVTQNNLIDNLKRFDKQKIYVYYIKPEEDSFWKDCLTFGRLVYCSVDTNKITFELHQSEKDDCITLTYNLPLDSYQLYYDDRVLKGINRESQLCITTLDYKVLDNFRYMEVGLADNQIVGQRVFMQIINYLREFFRKMKLNKNELFPALKLTKEQIKIIEELNNQFYPIKIFTNGTDGTISAENIISSLFATFTDYPAFFPSNDKGTIEDIILH